MSQDLQNLLQGAAAGGDIPQASVAMFAMPDMAAAIQAGLGVPVDDIPASEVVIFTLVIDDTGSITQARDPQTGGYVDHTDTIIDGHRLILDALQGSKQAADVLVATSFLLDGPLQGFTPVKDAVRLSRSSYVADGGHTPLRRALLTALGSSAAKAQEFAEAGVTARSVTLIITDGADNASDYGSPGNPPVRASDVNAVVRQMLASERHAVLFMGIYDGFTDFRAIARELGIPDNCVLTPGNNPSEIRAAFRVASQSFMRASQGGAGFSQVAGGGFGS